MGKMIKLTNFAMIKNKNMIYINPFHLETRKKEAECGDISKAKQQDKVR